MDDAGLSLGSGKLKESVREDAEDFARSSHDQAGVSQKQQTAPGGDEAEGGRKSDRDGDEISNIWESGGKANLGAEEKKLRIEAIKSEIAFTFRSAYDEEKGGFSYANGPNAPAKAGNEEIEKDSGASVREEALEELPPEEPEPVDIDSVALVKSPVVLRGIHSSRTPEARGSALARHGGGATVESLAIRSLRGLKENQAADGTKNGDVADTSASLLTPEDESAESTASEDIEITNLDAPQPDAAVETATESSTPRFKAAGVNPVVETAVQPFSTFSIDVDTAAYTLARRYLSGGFLPPAESVRTEEFVNFFDYAYRPPENGVFAVHVEGAPSKFGRGQQLLKIGIKGRRLGREESRGAVLTLLVDSSGSMNTPERIELAKKALTMLVERLGPADRISLIQYDNHARVLLEQAPATEKKTILAAIEGLQCSGSTNLEEGMRRAYEVAAAGFTPGAENRVLVLSDGAANLGALSAEDILRQVEAYRKQGILCSVFGLGQGTYNDEMLETLANKGDGVYRFIDSEAEARRVFVDDLAATLHTIARDVKIQVEFNGAVVARYRQLGYENRQLAKQDFRNDAVDAGEVGSGQSVTALYELELQPGQTPGRADAAAICTVRVRYRRMDNGRVEEVAQPFPLSALGTDFNAADGRIRLAAAVAEAAEILRGSPFAAGSEFERVAEVLRPVALEYHLDRQIQELLRWVQGAGGMSQGQ